MRINDVNGNKSIQAGDVSGVDLPQFVVLTGRNGAGKSNLLEGLATSQMYIEELGQLQQPDVRLFSLGQLLAASEGPTTASSYKDRWTDSFNTLENLKVQVRSGMGGRVAPPDHESWLRPQFLASGLMPETTLDRMLEDSQKSILELDIEDFRRYAPLLSGVRDPFTASIAEIFLSYANRRYSNDVLQFRDQKYGTSNALSDEQFLVRFGATPWELFNDTLQIVGLPYRFDAPPEDVESATYEVQLQDDRDRLISPGDLSSGERVLLAVAMSLFTGANLSEAIKLPSLLLLDEADASLHPSMVKSLLTVIEEVFVRQYGVMVIMATHSPTTVALAPESALYVMSRSTPKLQKTTTDDALRLLTVGISSLSVKVENRRQVFVESKYDQAVFQEYFALLKDNLPGGRSLEFVAAGTEAGGGCDAVKRLVRQLRDAGVDTVYGVVDRDERGGAPDNVEYVHDRYSIENLVLDPLTLGVFLLREQILTAEELGLAPGTRNFEITPQDVSSVVDAVTTRLAIDQTEVREVKYTGGASASVPTAMLDMRGHDLEVLAQDTFQELKRFRQGLKAEIVRRAVADRPDLVPVAVLDLFSKFA